VKRVPGSIRAEPARYAQSAERSAPARPGSGLDARNEGKSRAFFLNFDADDELADPSARTPSRATLARSRLLAERVRALLGPGDVIVPDPPDPAFRADGFDGRAWCPTPRALAALARAGARLPAAPPLAVLRRVNHRRFSLDLGRALADTRWIDARADLDRALAAPSPTGLWLLRRPFGVAGRGRLRLDPRRRDAVTERWIDATFAAGEGLEIAPWVERAGDFALHGYLPQAGDAIVGAPTIQRCDDDTGAWIDTLRAAPSDLADDERAALHRAAEEAASALRAAGYFGPLASMRFAIVTNAARSRSSHVARSTRVTRWDGPSGWATSGRIGIEPQRRRGRRGRRLVGSPLCPLRLCGSPLIAQGAGAGAGWP
jgi:hypothetical protein